MKHVTFEEYEAAKAEIIGGVQYKEDSTLEGDTIRKTYATEENGVFYEVNTAGRIEFWSDKHPESRIYDEAAAMAEAAAKKQPEERLPGYGEILSDKIRSETQDFSKLGDFEKFVLDRGFEFGTEEALKAGYDRRWKAGHGILISAEEYAAEVRSMNPNRKYDPDCYDVLVDLVEKKRLRAGDVYTYARFGWCVNAPEAIIAYQTDPDKWTVNNCGEVISEERARVEVCEEWGFEASRVKIIGTPYYDATDWQFIRFDCAHMGWLWAGGSLYQVYE